MTAETVPWSATIKSSNSGDSRAQVKSPVLLQGEIRIDGLRNTRSRNGTHQGRQSSTEGMSRIADSASRASSPTKAGDATSSATSNSRTSSPIAGRRAARQRNILSKPTVPEPPLLTTQGPPTTTIQALQNTGQPEQLASSLAAERPFVVSPDSAVPRRRRSPIKIPRLEAQQSPDSPTIFRSASSSSTVQHPKPLSRGPSGSSGNVACLEATAERLSLTSSIEDAIRDAHDDLKRNDSWRGSPSSTSSVHDWLSQPTNRRQSSIMDLNTAARSGGYSASGYVMSPTHSSFGGNKKAYAEGIATDALSRASSTRSHSETSNGGGYSSSALKARANVDPLEAAGRTSPRASVQQALVNMNDSKNVVLPPMAMSSAEQFESEEHAQSALSRGAPSQHKIDTLSRPAADSRVSGMDDAEFSSVTDAAQQVKHPRSSPEPSTRSIKITDFDDFDGVHCDPNIIANTFPLIPDSAEDDSQMNMARHTPRVRPRSYLDPATGQQMIFYPARVPAVLSLPPILGKGIRPMQRAAQREMALKQMSLEKRRSRPWLPSTSQESDGSIATHQQSADEASRSALSIDAASHESMNSGVSTSGGPTSSRPRTSILPPQLRATAFFDLPSAAPEIDVQTCSPTVALERLLDASASAPVHAFTGHAFAGHLGAEVYSQSSSTRRPVSNVRPSSSARSTTDDATTAQSTKNEKRKSVWSLIPGRVRPTSRSKLSRREGYESRVRVSGSFRDEGSTASSEDEDSSFLTPDAEEDNSTSGEEESEREIEHGHRGSEARGADLYIGAPTTLLAELQLRKQRHAQRLQPMQRDASGGLQTTLLERDAVAQLQARDRRQKAVSLAWDEAHTDSEAADDEDVPLALLAAKKGVGGRTDMSEAPRFGLLEQRDMEDNEPLSRRRERLQGRQASGGIYLHAHRNSSRRSMLPGSTIQPGDDRSVSQNAADAFGEGPLPITRPVSRAFSDELLGHFGATDTAKESTLAADSAKIATMEAEETLGQRRQRLRAEREAQDRGALQSGARQVSSTGSNQAIRRRSSMADILADNPLDTRQGKVDNRRATKGEVQASGNKLGRGSIWGGGAPPSTGLGYGYNTYMGPAMYGNSGTYIGQGPGHGWPAHASAQGAEWNAATLSMASLHKMGPSGGAGQGRGQLWRQI